MTAFNPATDYTQEWKWMSFVEDATWLRRSESPEPQAITGTKLRPLDMTSRRDMELAAGINVTEDQTLWQWWPGLNPITEKPKQRDLVRQEAGEKCGWVIQDVKASPFGFSILATVKEVLNVV